MSTSKASPIVKKKKAKKRKRFKKRKKAKSTYKKPKRNKQESLLLLIFFVPLWALIVLLGVFLIILAFPVLSYLIAGTILILAMLLLGIISGFIVYLYELRMISGIVALVIALAFLIWCIFSLNIFILILSIVLLLIGIFGIIV